MPRRFCHPVLMPEDLDVDRYWSLTPYRLSLLIASIFSTGVSFMALMSKCGLLNIVAIVFAVNALAVNVANPKKLKSLKSSMPLYQKYIKAMNILLLISCPMIILSSIVGAGLCPFIIEDDEPGSNHDTEELVATVFFGFVLGFSVSYCPMTILSFIANRNLLYYMDFGNGGRYNGGVENSKRGVDAYRRIYKTFRRRYNLDDEYNFNAPSMSSLHINVINGIPQTDFQIPAYGFNGQPRQNSLNFGGNGSYSYPNIAVGVGNIPTNYPEQDHKNYYGTTNTVPSYYKSNTLIDELSQQSSYRDEAEDFKRDADNIYNTKSSAQNISQMYSNKMYDNGGYNMWDEMKK